MYQHLKARIFLSTLILSGVLMAGTACYQDAISEKLFLEFRADGAVEAKSVVELLPHSDFQSRLPLDRVEQFRIELDNQRDPWTRRFGDVPLQNEKVVWEKEFGKLKRVEHAGTLRPASLQRFLIDTGLTLTVIDGPGWRELSIYPGSGTRATGQQRQEVQRQIQQWSSDIAGYLSSLERLYRYVDEHPDRAATMVGAILEEFITDEEKRLLDARSVSEQEVVDSVRDAMERVTNALVASDKQAYSLDELSSLVFDPFPAELVVQLPGVVLEAEGFDISGDNSVRVLPLRLWNALESLQELWIIPDPLVAWVNAARVEQEPINLAAFLARERRIIAAPAATTIRAAIEERLGRRLVYRVRWHVNSG